MITATFKHIAPTLSQQPGIYKYFDKKNELLYIGKAKNLRKRIQSYFSKNHSNYKTFELVNHIHRIECTVVDSEQDAFFLENSLIKKFQPRYNINLKDDKTYPYIVIKNERFPRVFLTRKLFNDGSEYLGPFTSVLQVQNLVEFIKQTIPIRNCTLQLSEKNIEKNKFKVCLEYHLGNCKGPCEGRQSLEDYQTGIEQLKNILKGRLKPVIQHFQMEMKQLSQKMEFEKAAQIKKRLDFLLRYQSKSVIVNPRLSNLDVFSILQHNNEFCINYLMIQNGTIVQTKTIVTQRHLDETKEEAFVFAIAQLRSLFKSDAKEIVIPLAINYPEKEVKLTIPKTGDKKKLLSLSEKNAIFFIEEKEKKRRLFLESSSTNLQVVLQEIKQELQLGEIPTHIECFDNSNFQGSFPVAAMVCFKNGLPSKKDYRHFNIKTVEGINDFASMKETILRRFKRLLNEKQSFPQLIIVDGGKGQLNAAIQAFKELNIVGKSTLVGLAKNEEELFFASDKQSLKLPLESESLRLIRRIRDEVHRFGLNFHRNKRSKGTFINELEQMKGIGEETAILLLRKYHSIENIKKISESELASLIGKSKAKIIYTYFINKKASHLRLK